MHHAVTEYLESDALDIHESLHALPPIGWMTALFPDGKVVGVQTPLLTRTSSDAEDVWQNVCDGDTYMVTPRGFGRHTTIALRSPDRGIAVVIAGTVYSGCPVVSQCLVREPERPQDLNVALMAVGMTVQFSGPVSIAVIVRCIPEGADGPIVQHVPIDMHLDDASIWAFLQGVGRKMRLLGTDVDRALFKHQSKCDRACGAARLSDTSRALVSFSGHEWMYYARHKECVGCGGLARFMSACACRAANYCSAECQRGDWPTHKLVCAHSSSKNVSASAE